MCNLAGYIGHRLAGPVLLDMMSRQEGFASGYYSGLATVSEGRLRYAKLVGDFARLRRETDVESLPGTVGIAHSRSNSGGDREWGHPFVDCAERMAYVANGSPGNAADPQRQERVVRELEAAGHQFRSRSAQPMRSYQAGPLLAGGEAVHLSEMMAHLVESLIPEHGPLHAMRLAYQTYPAEIVGLLLHADLPDAVVASRVNQPLVIGHGEGEIFMATTAIAFPAGAVHSLWMLPPNSSAAIYRDRVELVPFAPPTAAVSPHLPWSAAREAILSVLADGAPKGLGQFKSGLAPLWPEVAVAQRDLVAYETLRSLAEEGRIAFETERVNGATAELTAPRILCRRVD